MGRSDAVVRDILYNQDDPFDDRDFRRMCRFFLQHASRPIINRAIRSIFWCLGIRLRNVRSDESPDYLDFLQNQEAAQHIVQTRTRIDDTYRAAVIVCLAGWKTNSVSTQRLRDYLHRHADVCAWILGLHIFPYLEIFWDAPAAILDNEKVISTSFETRNYDNAFRNASLRIRSDRSIAIRAIKKSASAFIHLSEELQDDFELAKMAIAKERRAFNWVSRRLHTNRELRKLARYDGFPFPRMLYDRNDDPGGEAQIIRAMRFGEKEVLENVSVDYQNWRDFVLAVVSENGAALEFTLPKFRDDWTVVMTAVSNIGLGGGAEPVMEYASERLQDDRPIVLKAVEKIGLNLLYVSERLRDDEEVVSKAIEELPEVFAKASKRLRDNQRIADRVIELDLYQVQYASDRIRDDPLLMWRAIEEFPWFLQHASKRLKNDAVFVERAIAVYASNFKYASKRLRDNQHILEMAIDRDPLTLEYASERLKDNQHIVEMAVRRQPSALRFASARLQALLRSAT